MSRLIVLDFDGVIHSYTSKWVGPTYIPDPPVEGALEFMENCMTEGLMVGIYSTRNIEPGAIDAMRDWLRRHGMGPVLVERIHFFVSKPSTGSLFIDDRGYQFTGPLSWPSMEYLKTFKPWNK